MDVYGRYNELVNGVNLNQLITGGHHPVRKITIFTRSINHKWQCSMAMLNYQMVDMGSFINGGTHKWIVYNGKYHL